MITGLLKLLAPRLVGPIEEFAHYVESNAEKAIEQGQDPREAYRWALAGMVDWVKQEAASQQSRIDSLSPPGNAVDGRLTVSLAELLETHRSPAFKRRRKNFLKGVSSHVVYVVRDGKRVLYVGFTGYNAEHRIRQHIAGRSPLGIAIRSAGRDAEAWTVEMVSHPDRKTGLAVEKQLQDQYRPLYCAGYGGNDNANSTPSGETALGCS